MDKVHMHYWKRRVREAIWIKKTSRNSNLECGPDLVPLFSINPHSPLIPILPFNHSLLIQVAKVHRPKLPALFLLFNAVSS